MLYHGHGRKTKDSKRCGLYFHRTDEQKSETFNGGCQLNGGMVGRMKRRPSDIILILIISLLEQLVLMTSADGSVGENVLYKKLLQNYNANLRPVRRLDEKVNVTVDLGLTQIINMDERHQVLIWNGWVRQVWHDYRLTWNTSEFSNINDIAFDKDSIWTPDMALYNNAQENFQLLDAEAFERIIAHNDGRCLWMVPFVFKTICKIDVTYFPFDEQVCEFEIGSWAYTGAYLNISHLRPEGDLSEYSQNSAWVVLKMSTNLKIGYYSCCPEPYPSIIFRMHLRRRALYYVYKIIMPSCLIAVLAILSFFLPTSSGERVTLLITNFVSLALFILMLSSIVPPTSETTPLLEVYLTAVFIEISAALLLRCVIDMAKRKHGRPGYFVRKFVCYYLARLLCVKPLPYVEAILNTDKVEENLELDSISLYFADDIEVVRSVPNHGSIIDRVNEQDGVINSVIDDASPSHINDTRYHSKAGENCQVDSNCMDQKLSKVRLKELREKILGALESVSDSVRQKWLAKIRQREYSEIASTLDKIFFWLFALTITGTMAFVFLTPPNVVM